MQYFHSVLSDTITAAGLFDAYDLVGFNDQKIAADDAPVQAVAQNPATEVGQAVAGILIGIVRVRARGVITKGDKLTSAAAGGVKKAAVGAVNIFATAYSSAADGEFVKIFVVVVR